MPDYLIQAIYLIGTLLFIFGLKRMCSPVKANRGIIWISIGVLMTILVTYFHPQVLEQYFWITLAMLTGAGIAIIFTKSAKTSDIPKLIALFNSMGGGAVAAIAAVELIKLGSITQDPKTDIVKYLAIAGALLGSLSFSASLVSFARLQGLLKKAVRLPMHQWINALIFVISVTFGIAIILNGNQFELSYLVLLFVLAIILGVLMALPIGNTDLPISISFFNGLTGLAVCFIGFVQSIPAMMIAGTLAAAAGIVMAKHMAKAKHSSIARVLFGEPTSNNNIDNHLNVANLKEISSVDAAIQLAFAKRVILIPGYGMAASQAQDKLSMLSRQLNKHGVDVKYAIHPAAGRMPGHMNTLLADAGIPYDDIYDLDQINADFSNTDVVLIVGGNDITNPIAHSNQQGPLFGMHILNADQAKQVIVIKRSNGLGFSNIENPLFYSENTSMLYGDAQTVLIRLIIDVQSV